MSTLLSFLNKLFPVRSFATLEEEYLSDATDLVDLERRMRELERHQRPAFGL